MEHAKVHERGNVRIVLHTHFNNGRHAYIVEEPRGEDEIVAEMHTLELESLMICICTDKEVIGTLVVVTSPGVSIAKSMFPPEITMKMEMVSGLVVEGPVKQCVEMEGFMDKLCGGKLKKLSLHNLSAIYEVKKE